MARREKRTPRGYGDEWISVDPTHHKAEAMALRFAERRAAATVIATVETAQKESKLEMIRSKDRTQSLTGDSGGSARASPRSQEIRN